MSIIDDVLITVDDQDRNKDELEAIFPKVKTAILFSALGRLVSKKMILENGKGKNKTYTITTLGSQTVEGKLGYLRNLIDDKTFYWVLVSLSIPEKFKVERERLRLTLKDWGFGLVKNGLFIGQVNNIIDFKDSLDKLKHNSQILIFEINTIPDELSTHPAKYWNISKLKGEYTNWSHKTKLLIKDLPKDPDIRRIYAKCAVYELSDIIKSDPKIKNVDFSNSIGRDESIKLYKEIREYCY
jgi:DNA-binding transcriptional regulator PaaX